jgi:putative sporulation protein YyaC
VDIIKANTFTIESSRSDALYMLSNMLSKELKTILISNPHEEYSKELVVLCIGTDRSTGDCLGPLVGDKLTKLHINKKVGVYGTLKNPVHAKNLEEKTQIIYNEYSSPIILAVDASLGRNENVGKINLYNGPIYPGSGVNKKLNPIGDLSITGIVNMGGFMEYVILQNTRLSLVMDMADIITNAIYISIARIFSLKTNAN